MTCKKVILIVIFAIVIVVFGILFYFFYVDDASSIEDIIDIDTSSDDIDWSSYEKKNISLSESLTLTSPSVYVLTGVLDGNITIDMSGNIKLILNGVTINSDNGPAIYVENADNVVISTVDGTSNTLSDASSYNGYDFDVEGAIYSKDDIVFEGDGTLILNGNYGDALVSKDDLLINSGTYIINAMDDGIRGKDSVYIRDGNFTVNSYGDAVKSTNDKDSSKGYVLIEDGIFNIKTSNTSSDVSSKGIKAVNAVIISGGEFDIDTTDDSIHSNNVVKIDDGVFEISSLDDGIHADNDLIVSGGKINVNKSYEGLEAKDIVIKGGSFNIVSSDDGINASSVTDDVAVCSIYGGDIKISASGDGIDSNGSIYMYGGNVFVDGPVSDGDGALDYDDEFIISGGVLVASGQSGMALGISGDSTQYGVLINLSNRYQEGDDVLIVDEDDEEILSYTASKSFSSICYSSNDLEKGESYKLKINGEVVQSFTISDISTIVGMVNQGPGK